VQREKGGMNYFLPQMNIIFKNDKRHILSCKKQIGTSFEYIISINSTDFAIKNPTYVARLSGNFTNSVFNLINDKTNEIICTTRFREDAKNNVIAPLMY